MNKGTLIGVYGGLRKDSNLFFEIDSPDVKYLGQYITEPIYNIYNIENVYPGVKRGGNQSLTLDMFEICKIEYEDIIDEIMGYSIVNTHTNLFNKHVIETSYGSAFIYIYNRDITQNNKIVESGDWVYELSQFNKYAQSKYEEKI